MHPSLPPSSLVSAIPRHQPEIGQLIRDLRHLTDQTQQQFANVLGVSFSTLNRWENGRMQPSSLGLKQVESVLAELEQSTNPSLHKGSRTLLQKYERTRR